MDSLQGYTRKHKLNSNYDIGQHLIVEYTRLGFHKSYGLFKLFFFMVKVIIYKFYYSDDTSPIFDILYLQSFV